MNNKWKIVVFLLIVVSGTFSGCLLWASRSDARLPANTFIGVLPVGGFTLAEIHAALKIEQAAYNRLPLQITQIERRVYRPAEWGLTLDVERTYEAVKKAWDRVHPIERIFGSPSITVRPVWQVDDDTFQKRLLTLRFLEIAPRDAKAEWKDKRVVILPEQSGRKIDPIRTRQNLINAALTLSGRLPQQLASRHSSPPANRIVFELAFQTFPPRITREKLKSVRSVIASYTTHFPGYQTNRNNNIRLAAQALDGKILIPGDKLSYNEVVGQRSRTNGFRLAPIIVRGEQQLGIGGGICQVSSTLFNAAMLADMKIARRHNHSIPIAYVPRGRDATVTDTGLDLVIENNHPYPVVISSEVRRSSIVIRILGAPEPGKRVVVQTQWLGTAGAPIRYENDPHLPAGKQKIIKKGSPGSRVRTVRRVYVGNQLVRSEVIAVSTYNAQPRVIARGTNKAAPKPPPSFSSPASLADPASQPPDL